MLTTKQAVRVHVRFAIRRDTPEVLAIEASSAGHATPGTPWTEAEYHRCLTQGNYVCSVAEFGDSAVGFMVWEFKRRSLCLHKLAVAHSWRRRGVGGQLLTRLKSKVLPPRDQASIAVQIPERNLGAQLFLRSQGFLAEKIVRGDEDSYLFGWRREF